MVLGRQHCPSCVDGRRRKPLRAVAGGRSGRRHCTRLWIWLSREEPARHVVEATTS
uniref:Uncharacterized protein n=1 Tax=Oryza sativa subsp. japonica TaxID=39947 RepID=Q69L17_ORYSJ|nr:hypothetical protein [Oryza sativa Japonica Group]BAD34100.1 hypothetical protein [Oryza sativa Japonica Group]